VPAPAAPVSPTAEPEDVVFDPTVSDFYQAASGFQEAAARGG